MNSITRRYPDDLDAPAEVHLYRLTRCPAWGYMGMNFLSSICRSRVLLALTISLAALVSAACAPMVPIEGATFTPIAASAPPLQLSTEVNLKLSTGYSRTLPAGSSWRAVGTLPQGTVYQRINDVFTIEGRQVHEAYLVVQRSALLGFYLPAEGIFSPLTPSVSLPLGAP